jgi:hypothetical protein
VNAVTGGLAEVGAQLESPDTAVVAGGDLVPIGVLGGSMTMRSSIKSRQYLRDSEKSRPLLVVWP